MRIDSQSKPVSGTTAPVEPKAVAKPLVTAGASTQDTFVAAKGFGIPSPTDWVTDKLVDALQSFALKANAVPLTAAQKAEMQKVFGNSVDLDAVGIVKGPAVLFDHLPRDVPAFTLGNTVIVNPNYYPPSDELLSHELTHTWQFQNGGGDYAVKALVAQNLGDGYDWQKGVAEGKKWGDLNPEQQGQLIQTAYAQGFFDGPGKRFVVDGKDYTDYLNAAVKEMRAGQGTPDWDFSKATNPVKEAASTVVEKGKEVVEKGVDTVKKAWGSLWD